MNILATIAAGVALVVVLVVVVFLGLGETKFWQLFGESDLGDVALETVQRRSSPNDALAGPAGFCAARTDLTTTVYKIPARELRAAFARVLASEPKIAVAHTNNATMTDRYIQRTGRLGFPDTIIVRFLDRPDGQSTLALYSRSRFGESDFGVNRARIERWLTKLATQANAVQ